MKNKPLVSIVVPVYNAEKYLNKCLNSLAEQNYTNLEIIIVNDGSKDSSRNIAEDYARLDKRCIVVNKKNSGVSSARNKGILQARGSYITFIDADDVVHRQFISNLVDDLQIFDADIVTTNKQSYQLSDIDFLSTELSNQVVLDELSSKKALELLYIGNLEKGHNGVQLFRRSLIVDHKLLYDTKMNICEDFDFLARAIMKTNKIVFDPRDMYYYRINYSGAMQTMTIIRHVESMNNKQQFGRKILTQFPFLENILNENLCLDSISCGSLIIKVKDQYPKEFKPLMTNIYMYKYSTLFSRRINIQNRMKVLIVVMFGNHIGLQILSNIIKLRKADTI